MIIIIVIKVITLIISAAVAFLSWRTGELAHTLPT